MRHCDCPSLKYYEKLVKNLAVLINKTIMTHDTAATAVVEGEFRDVTLHTFLSGLKRSLKQAVLIAQPRNLPTALALAQKAESSNVRLQIM